MIAPEHPLKELWDSLREGHVSAPCDHPDCDRERQPGWLFCGPTCAQALLDGTPCTRCEDADQSEGRPDVKEGFPHPSGLCAKCEQKHDKFCEDELERISSLSRVELDEEMKRIGQSDAAENILSRLKKRGVLRSFQASEGS
jgi:hypothetical protein